MINKIKYLVSKRSIHSSLMIVIIAAVGFAVGVNILRYVVEGETNMPFNLTKITIISSAEGMDKQAGMQETPNAETIEDGSVPESEVATPTEVVEESKWNFDINQNNDIYIYIEKNQNISRQEVIESVVIDNIKVEKQEEKGQVNFYRPNINEAGTSFSNTKENLVENVRYEGALETDLKNLKISNQGGLIAFRYSNDKVAEYKSNEDEINHSELLKKANVTVENLKAKLSFDIVITLGTGKEYTANVVLDVPVQDTIEKGTASLEITDLTNIIFKRTKN